MDQSNIKQNLNDIKRLHARASNIWTQKKKYLQSMKKSQSYLLQFSKKEENEDRARLKIKLKNHIAKIMNEYLAVIEQLKLISHQAEKEFQLLSLNIEKQDWTTNPQIQQGVKSVLQIRQILKSSSQF